MKKKFTLKKLINLFTEDQPETKSEKIIPESIIPESIMKKYNIKKHNDSYSIYNESGSFSIVDPIITETNSSWMLTSKKTFSNIFIYKDVDRLDVIIV